jgi:hypothetical protein
MGRVDGAASPGTRLGERTNPGTRHRANCVNGGALDDMADIRPSCWPDLRVSEPVDRMSEGVPSSFWQRRRKHLWSWLS